MKIICDTCGTKYSIADEKVAGKAFKIRCKKCNELIFLRGEIEVMSTPETDALWYVVIDGEQQGPLTDVQVERLAMAGRLDGETFCWCNGFDDWSHIRNVEALQRFVEPRRWSRSLRSNRGRGRFVCTGAGRAGVDRGTGERCLSHDGDEERELRALLHHQPPGFVP